MIRVLFVRPKCNPRYIALALPPLGAMSLAATLRERAAGRVDVRILDMSIERDVRSALARTLEDFTPDVVGLSAMTPEAPDMAYFADWFKKRYPDALVIAGGPHANAGPSETLSMPGMDLIALGEGEQTMLRLVECLSEGKSFEDLPGLVMRRGGADKYNEPVEPIADLDSLPFPARDLVPIKDYCSWRVVNPSMSRKHKLYTTIFTSRACPYLCEYCHNIFGTKFRIRSPQNIYDEMRHLEDRYGFREFHVVDDNFNLQRDRVYELCDLMIKGGRRYSLAFVSGLRGDILTKEVIEKLRDAGTYHISFGIETGSPRLQKLIKRHGHLPRLMENINTARKAGIVTHGFFILGFPTETREEIQATADLALSANLVTAAFHTMAPYPGTPMYELLKQRMGDKAIRMEEMFFKSTTMNMSEVDTDELNGFIKTLFRRFYFQPRRIWNIWSMAPRKIDVVINTVFHMLLDPRLLKFRDKIMQRLRSPAARNAASLESLRV